MPEFTAPTYEQPVDNPLGKHGVAFTVGLVIYIDTGDNVHETTSIIGKFSEHVSPDGLGIKAGSGDNGLAIFRRGRTYEVTAGEETLLTAAGYTVS